MIKRILLLKEWKETSRAALLFLVIPPALAAAVVLSTRIMIRTGIGLSPDFLPEAGAERLAANMYGIYGLILLVSCLAAPLFLLAGRFASERSEGTLELLSTLPLGKQEIFTAKALIGLVQFVVIVLVTTLLLHQRTWAAFVSVPSTTPGDYAKAIALCSTEAAVAASLFLLASVAFATPSLAGLAGYALYLGYAVMHIVIDRDYSKAAWYPVSFLTFSIAIGLACVLWRSGIVIRIGWRTIIVLTFILPSVITAYVQFKHVVDRDLRIAVAENFDPTSGAYALAADAAGFWTAGHEQDTRTGKWTRTLTRREWVDGAPRMTETLKTHVPLEKITLWNDRIVNFHSYGDTGRSPITTLTIIGRTDSVSIPLNEVSGFAARDIRSVSSGKFFAFLHGPHLYIVEKTADSYLLTHRREYSSDLGFDGEGRLLLMRCQNRGALNHVYAPTFWRIDRENLMVSKIEPAPAPAGITVKMTDNIVADGRIFTAWMRIMPSENSEPVYDALRGKALFAGNALIWLNGNDYSPNVFLCAKKTANLDWYLSKPNNREAEMLVVTNESMERHLRGSARWWTFPPLDGHVPLQRHFSNIAVTNNKVMAVDGYGALWIDLDKIGAIP